MRKIMKKVLDVTIVKAKVYNFDDDTVKSNNFVLLGSFDDSKIYNAVSSYIEDCGYKLLMIEEIYVETREYRVPLQSIVETFDYVVVD